MGKRSILDVLSPPKAAPSAAARASSSESSPSPSPSSSSSPAAVGANGTGYVPALPAGVSAAPLVPSGGFGPPTLLVAPSAALVATTTPTTPIGIVAPARSSECNGDDDAAVLAFLATDGEDAVGEGPAASSALTSLVPVPQPTSLMTWAALQAELLRLEPGLVGRENLRVPPWPAGEPSYKHIQRWRRALATAVDRFDVLSPSLAPATRLRRLILELRDRYGRQLAFAQDGYAALEGSAAREPEVCRTPPPESPSPVGTPARHVSSSPASSRKRARTAKESSGAGPSSAKKKRKKDLSSSPDPTPPPPPPPKRPRSRSVKSLFDEDGVPVQPCDQCATKRRLCVAHPSRDPCQRCCDDHIKCSWSEMRREARGLPARAGTRGRDSGSSSRGRRGRARAACEYSPPAPRRAPPASSLLPNDDDERMEFTSGGLADLLRRAARDDAADALAGLVRREGPRSALRTPGQHRVRFGSTVGTPPPLDGPPTEPLSTPGSRRGEDKEGEEDQTGRPAGGMDLD
ncbi:hypothetical protein AURDEDRAFT_162833 [Auricularia subglabra TFB-10046 SS5]|nr:hypothetical protein AURDEDRAFT_162833 [Auricularia subglabra TFB-10046 SS5]